MAWFDDLPALYAFERDARRELGGLSRRLVNTRLVYELELDVPGYDDIRRVHIEFPATAVPEPHVFADGPGSRHRYGDGSLCFDYPLDPPERRWTPEDGLAGLIDIIRTHLFQEEELRHGHPWPGDEAPHAPVTGRRR